MNYAESRIQSISSILFLAPVFLLKYDLLISYKISLLQTVFSIVFSDDLPSIKEEEEEMILNGNNIYAVRKLVPVFGDGTCLKPYQARLLPQTFPLIFCLQINVTLKIFSFFATMPCHLKIRLI